VNSRGEGGAHTGLRAGKDHRGLSSLEPFGELRRLTARRRGAQIYTEPPCSWVDGCSDNERVSGRATAPHRPRPRVCPQRAANANANANANASDPCGARAQLVIEEAERERRAELKRLTREIKQQRAAEDAQVAAVEESKGAALRAADELLGQAETQFKLSNFKAGPSRARACARATRCELSPAALAQINSNQFKSIPRTVAPVASQTLLSAER
jgi:hypothetical protein